MKKFICREFAGVERAPFPENELFHEFFFQEFYPLLWNKYLKV